MKRKHKSNSNVKTVLAILLLSILIAGVVYFIYSFLQVENIKIIENKEFEDTYIENLSDIQEKTHMFFLNEDKIKENIEKEPYLEVVEIKKVYPNTVNITVMERQAKVLVKYAEQYLLLDEDANVLEILNALPQIHYPIVDGFSINAITLGKPLATEDTFKVSVLNQTIEELYSKNINDAIENIDLADINSIKMQSMEGMTIKFGQSDKIADKVKKIKKMFAQLKKEGRTGGILDVSAGTMATYKPDEIAPSAQPLPEPSKDNTLPEVENANEDEKEEDNANDKNNTGE